MAVMLSATGSAAATLYVDVKNASCSDAATYAAAQSQATPLCGPAAAAAMVLPGDTVQLKAGTYTLSGRVNLSRSGTAAQPITVEPFGDGPAVLSGPHSDAGLNGPCVYVTGNYVIVQGLELTGSQGQGVYVSATHVGLRGLRIHDTDDDGVYVGGVSSDVIVEGNISLRNGVAGSGHSFSATGARIVFRNNVGSRSADQVFQLYPACNDCDVYNNLAHGSVNSNGFVIGGLLGVSVNANVRLFNNISLGNADTAIEIYQNGDGGVLLSNNLEFANPGGGLHISGAPSDYTVLVPMVTADPKLADVDAGNWHLLPGSPAIDTGSATLAPPTDFEGDVRPFGAGFDIGPDEFTDGGAAEGGPDAGLPDAGERDGGVDGGPSPRVLTVGCGCGAGALDLPAAAVLMLALRRRRI
jgi:hypothetical protein